MDIQLPSVYEGYWIYPHEATWGETICEPFLIDEMQMKLGYTVDGDPWTINDVRERFAQARAGVHNEPLEEAREAAEGIIGYWVVPGVIWAVMGGIMDAEGVGRDSLQYLQWECLQRSAAALSVMHVGLEPA